MKAFRPNAYPTVGVEEEFHLVDPVTAEMVPCVDAVMARLAERRQPDGTPWRERVSHEMFQSVLEGMSRPARTIDELVADITEARRVLAEAARREGALLVAAGSHPFCDYRTLDVVESEHYQWVRANHGIISRRLLAFGLHVHVGVTGPDAALYVMHEMRPWVYVLAALTANSPLLEGGPAGLQSARTHLFNAMPRTYFPPTFETFDELTAHYETLLAAGDVTRPGDLWWNIRPQPPLGTVEIRTLDLPTDVGRVGAAAALYQAACATFQDAFGAGRPRTKLAEEFLDQNRWRAMRDGLDATLIDVRNLDVIPMRHAVARLVDLVAPKARELGSEAWLDEVHQICQTGNEATQQLSLYGQFDGDLVALELELARRSVLG